MRFRLVKADGTAVHGGEKCAIRAAGLPYRAGFVESLRNARLVGITGGATPARPFLVGTEEGGRGRRAIQIRRDHSPIFLPSIGGGAAFYQQESDENKSTEFHHVLPPMELKDLR